MSTNIGAMAASHYIKNNSSNATSESQKLSSGTRTSNPSFDPSAAAIGFRLTSSIDSKAQALSNSNQAKVLIQMATAVLGNTNSIITRMKTLALQSANGVTGASERSMLNQEYTQLMTQITNNATNARWGGVSLFTGGGGTATVNATVAAAGATGLTAVANATAGTLNAASRGLIHGVASDVSVTANGSVYNIAVKVGDQTFIANGVKETAGGTLNLVSNKDSSNVIVLDYAAAVTGITNAATFTSSLRTTLGLDTATKAVFTSAGAALPAGAAISAAGAGTKAGTYSLSYTNAAAGGTGIFKLSNGNEVFTQNVTTSASMTQGVTFDNGFSLALTAFDGTAAVATQSVVTVTAGTNISMTVPVSDRVSDIVTLTFRGATATALNLASTSIDSQANANTAATSLENSLTQVNTYIAELGGNVSQLNSVIENLQIARQNEKAARAVFIETDIIDSLANLQEFQALKNIAYTTFTKSLEDSASLAQVVQRAG